MFYLKVEGKGFPQKEHATIEEAETEALRLAAKEGRRVAIFGVNRWIEPQRLYRIIVTAGGRDFRSAEMTREEAEPLMREVLDPVNSRLESRLPNQTWSLDSFPA